MSQSGLCTYCFEPSKIVGLWCVVYQITTSPCVSYTNITFCVFWPLVCPLLYTRRDRIGTCVYHHSIRSRPSRDEERRHFRLRYIYTFFVLSVVCLFVPYVSGLQPVVALHHILRNLYNRWLVSYYY